MSKTTSLLALYDYYNEKYVGVIIRVFFCNLGQGEVTYSGAGWLVTEAFHVPIDYVVKSIKQQILHDAVLNEDITKV